MKKILSKKNTDEWIISIATFMGYVLSFLLGLFYFTDLIQNGSNL
ncbi:MAG: hypothetical protein AAGI07_10395 [Bacteroidota bacterium]